MQGGAPSSLNGFPFNRNRTAAMACLLSRAFRC
jgi:hypothetical protein